MSVYIKGMEMPTTCLSCDFHKCAGGVGDYCTLTKKKQFRFKNRPSYCPLVPVPPHGRLIDGDYLKHTHCAECTLYPDKCLEKTADGCDWGSIIHLRMCPTVIPADNKEVK